MNDEFRFFSDFQKQQAVDNNGIFNISKYQAITNESNKIYLSVKRQKVYSNT